MKELFYKGGLSFMFILTILIILILVISISNFINFYNRKVMNSSQLLKRIKLVKSIGVFALVFGILGQLAHPLLVKKQLKQIFNFREQKLTDLFGTLENKTNEIHFKSI